MKEKSEGDMVMVFKYIGEVSAGVATTCKKINWKKVKVGSGGTVGEDWWT